MKRELIFTRDGSHTISIPDQNLTYHSIHGAILESQHVFIKNGLDYAIANSQDAPLRIFEMGFGTGLNTFISVIHSAEKMCNIHYTSIETDPLQDKEFNGLNYPQSLGHDEWFRLLHSCNWEDNVLIHEDFLLQKKCVRFEDFKNDDLFDLVYYDAFAPSAQPELWTEVVFRKIRSMMKAGAVMVTYCSKGDVRRAMISAGFKVKKLPGPPGKREMLQAIA